jgi:hypothetical protein
MPLYCIQDEEAPCWVVADSYDHAVRQWHLVFGEEYDGAEPEGILLICGNDKLVIDSKFYSDGESS